MQIEVCDLCERRVNNLNSTKVIIKDCKFPTSRKFKGVICDNCLKLLKEGNYNQIPKAVIYDGVCHGRIGMGD